MDFYTMSETCLNYRILFPNGKSYIGWTKNSLEQRKSEHLKTTFHKKRRYAVHEAILKFGPDSLKWEVLYESTDVEFSLNIMEPYLIRLYQSFIDQNGYNLTWGGDAPGLGVVQSEESKRKRSLSLIGRKVGGRNRPLYESEKNTIRERQMGAGNSFYGKTHSLEVRKKIQDAQRLASKGRLRNEKGHFICSTSHTGGI